MVGFIMPTISSESQLQGLDILSQQPFYEPRFATVPSSSDGSVEAACRTDTSAVDDTALPLSVICVEEMTGSRNEGQ